VRPSPGRSDSRLLTCLHFGGLGRECQQLATVRNPNVTATPLPHRPYLIHAASVRNKILVVEDDVDLVELLKFNLINAGFSVTAATEGSEGLKKARSWLPDLILLDLMLPELDGFAICEILRRDASTSKIPIIILTAMSSQLARVAGMGAGADDYICKPFSPKNLLARIDALLNRVAESRSTKPLSRP